MDNMIEPEKKIKIFDRCDVLVVGGGIAGVASALAAARNGSKVILIEKQFSLGGLATLGLITVYLPLCDGMGNQVIFGIGEELLRLSIKFGYEDRYPDAWLDCNKDDEAATEKRKKQRFLVQYNPHLFAIALEQLLLDNGVRIFYDTLICDVKMEGDNITAIVAESREGRLAFEANAVIDATGDANICHLAGAPTEVYKKFNPLAAWYYYSIDSQVKLKQFGAADIPTEDGLVNNNAHLTDKRYSGLKMLEVSEMIIESHKAILSDVLENKKRTPSYMPVTIPGIPQLRMTRRIVGEYQMNKNDVFLNLDDSVGVTGDWRNRGPVYEIPLRSLYSKTVKNLITAGRCISTTDTMWDVTRAIPTCAVTGEAAGTAAALSYDIEKTNIQKLQKQLQKQGVILHFK